MRIPLAERQRLVDQVTEDLVAVFPLAREVVRVRVGKCVHDVETLHEFFRSKNGRTSGRQNSQDRSE